MRRKLNWADIEQCGCISNAIVKGKDNWCGADGLVAENVEFRKCNLSKSVWQFSRFKDCLFLECDLYNASFHECTFENCRFVGCAMADFSSKNCRHRNCLVEESSCCRAKIFLSDPAELRFESCNLSEIVLYGNYFNDRFLDFICDSHIGNSKQGTVYFARSISDNRKVAIKIFDKNDQTGAGDEESRRKNRHREVKSLTRVESRYVAQLIAANQDSDEPYVILERAPGESLEEWFHKWRKGHARFTLEQMQVLMTHAFEGLRDIHAMHDQLLCVHRDIKPANIVICAEPLHLTIVDLGLSRFLENRHFKATACGTPQTMAPELLQQFFSKEVEELDWVKIDIFALGVTLFRMLSGGQDPFQPEICKTSRQRAIENGPNLKLIPEQFRSVIGRCLEFDPANRWHAVEEILLRIAA